MDENGYGWGADFNSELVSISYCTHIQKINAGNSWSLELIDYFHDMSLLRNNTDNSINFQKASSTLDGCVKIWTSRVDSVGTETGKLLSNLASGGRDDGDEDDPGSDNPDAQDPSQKVKRKAQRHESTLVKNRAQLKVKKLDLEFSVDPLFRKTSEDFDEGGAHGLLQNHLSLGVGSEGALRVIFDASDSMGRDDEDEDEDPQEQITSIDLRALKCMLLNKLSASLETHEMQHTSLTSRNWMVRRLRLRFITSPLKQMFLVMMHHFSGRIHYGL
jgi:condensin complex subunit 2